jgi:hypothetical protein
MWSSFIHKFLWMNKCHKNFAFPYKSMCQKCFQCTILVREMYKLRMNEFYIISITKSWDAKFMMHIKIHCVMPLNSWRWLLALNIYIWINGLCVHVAYNNEYFGCDSKMCYFSYVESFTFQSVTIRGLRWLSMEGSCAQLCDMSSSQCGWTNRPIFNNGPYWPIMHVTWQS